MIDIIANIIRIRKEKGLTQKALSEKIGMPQANYARIETGETQLTIDKLEKIAKAFELSIEELFTHGKLGTLNLEDKIKNLEEENNQLRQSLSKHIEFNSLQSKAINALEEQIKLLKGENSALSVYASIVFDKIKTEELDAETLLKIVAASKYLVQHDDYIKEVAKLVDEELAKTDLKKKKK